MQRFALFTGSCQSLPIVQYLLQTNKLACVVLIEAEPNPDLAQLQYWLQQNRIQTLQFSKSNDNELLAGLDKLGANRGLIYMFRHKIKATLIQYFSGYLINIHPSPLPDYRGPFPLYWQLRNAEETTHITLHQVSEDIDSGDIAAGMGVDIAIHPFETMSSLQQKVAQTIPHVIERFCQADEQQKLKWQPQSAVSEKLAPLLEHRQLIVNWRTQTAKQIMNMARAGNVDTGCAIFTVGKDMFQLLQASNVDCPIAGLLPGTVVEIDRNRGLIIKSKDGAVRFDVVSTQQGLFDGYRFAVLFGLEAGMTLPSK
ncbi:methionyl-tRNA formyltransferase [Pseudoalteromonas sp. S16_S37]|uniref:methionyl-tRNA formyltransferase n=1 Tax=Pseudoalteromonas sp. S16_S37 TaxID=2720228 RepID=UPI001681936C|nr:formyltransferase family protein [Pseudoalteromonas sp. S16_S37]MBD1581575.1 hypothetical protein [Pseudoalteromonas sp. S16_S37]